MKNFLCLFGFHQGKWEIATATYTGWLISNGREERCIQARVCTNCGKISTCRIGG